MDKHEKKTHDYKFFFKNAAINIIWLILYHSLRWFLVSPPKDMYVHKWNIIVV